MPSPKKQKSIKAFNLINNYEPQQSNNSFLRSYSQLLNKHFSQSHKEKSELRKSLSTSKTFRTKKHKHSPKKDKNSKNLNEDGRQSKFGQNDNSIELGYNPQSFERSEMQNSLDPELLGSRASKQKMMEFNHEENLKLEKILMSKTQMIQKNSRENVFLNQKLYQSSHQKRTLMQTMQTLRMEILKQKKIKAKISTQMGKLMNKIEEVNNNQRKTQEERFYLRKETKLIEKELIVEQRRNEELTIISQLNNEKIGVEKDMINALSKELERTKAEFFETRTHLNEIKQIYMRETKCLVKVEMHKHQSEQEMNLLYKTIEQSVIHAKESPKI